MNSKHAPIEWKNAAAPVEYGEALAFMEERVQRIREGLAPQCVWLLEHPPVYTAGTSAKREDLLGTFPFPVFDAGRGGQYTYHGPGQRIAYTMLDLKQPSPFNQGSPDIRAYVTFLEQWVIEVLAHFGLKGRTYKERVGVWVDDPARGEAKIAAIGIRVRQWVTFHGISLNVTPDLSHFGGIVPCGISQYGVTSLEALGIRTIMNEVDALLKTVFEKNYAA